MWIARNKKGHLFVFKNKPQRNIQKGIFGVGVGDEDFEYLEENLIKMPFNVTWENSPIEIEEVEIKIKNN